MLELIHFSKTYKGGKKAASDINLSVAAGDIYGFVGHNGAGKSTTIRAIVGVLEFEEGDITIGGHSVRMEPMECKKVTAYIPDNPDLYEHLTGVQYLNFVADIYGISPADKKERISRYADAFEITGELGNVLSSYSHGMRQKIAIIAALVHDPKLIVMDEPFVGLDPKASLTLKNIMKERCSEGCAIFFSTHVLDVAQKLCNKIAIIKAGSIVAAGTMEEMIKEQSLEEVFMEVVENA